MALIHKSGNIFDTTSPVIGHGVNLQGDMGGGIAAQIAEKFPEVEEDYIYACDNKYFELGEIWISPTHSGLLIANMATQITPGRDARLEAVNDSLRMTLDGLVDKGIPSIALPQIGAGIGGLEWADVLEVFEKAAEDYPELDIEVWTYVPPKLGGNVFRMAR